MPEEFVFFLRAHENFPVDPVEFSQTLATTYSVADLFWIFYVKVDHKSKPQ